MMWYCRSLYKILLTNEISLDLIWWQDSGVYALLLQPLGPRRYKGPLLLAWINFNYIHYKVRDEITYPFLNFNDATVEG